MHTSEIVVRVTANCKPSTLLQNAVYVGKKDYISHTIEPRTLNSYKKKICDADTTFAINLLLK